jgi:adenosylcobinamide-GDP ribazoletransferase
LSLAGLFGFFSRLPAPAEDLQEIGASAYLLPLVGVALGLALYAFALPLALWAPPDLASVALMGSLYLLTGILHLDGLADFGDALATPGTRGRRREAMKDPRVGVGGLLAVALILLTLFSSFRLIFSRVSTTPLDGLLPRGHLAAALVTSELAAKLSVGFCAGFGRPLEAGMGHAFSQAFRRSHAAASLALAVPLALVLSGSWGLLLFIGPPMGALTAAVAARTVGGVSGDVLGASNEMGRAAALAAWSVLAWMS